MIKVKATPRFTRLAKKSMTPESFQELIDTLALYPERGAIIKDLMASENYVGQLAKVAENEGGYAFYIILMVNILFYWSRCLKNQTKKTSTLVKKEKCVS